MTSPASEHGVEYWADWLVDAVGGATQNRMFLRHDPAEDKVATDAIYLNGRHAIERAVKSALAAEREACAKVVETGVVSASGCIVDRRTEVVAAAIRARGGK